MTGAVIAEVRDYNALVQGLRQRIAALGTSFDAIDELLLLARGFTGKFLAPRPSKFMSARLFGDILSAAAVRLLMVEDEVQLERIKDRLTPRSTWGVRLDGAVTITRSRRFFRDIGRKGGLARKPPGRRRMQRLGRARMATLSGQERQELARRAANKRWKSQRAAASLACQATVPTPMNSA
jgi:hypothetical protein